MRTQSSAARTVSEVLNEVPPDNFVPEGKAKRAKKKKNKGKDAGVGGGIGLDVEEGGGGELPRGGARPAAGGRSRRTSTR
eukprot:SAG22_NODE_1757_length_3650_cov_2.473669_4_plen_80_part_00